MGAAHPGEDEKKGDHMTLCPVALAVGCQKCVIFKVCPAKGIIGDYKAEPPKSPPKK